MGKNKLDCIEMLISQSITDVNVSHKELKMIMNEKKDYDNQKNIINESKLNENAQIKKNIIFFVKLL